jgi:hypothetical protein
LLRQIDPPKLMALRSFVTATDAASLDLNEPAVKVDVQPLETEQFTHSHSGQALRTRHIILSKEGEKGIYRLQHKGFALWINLYAQEESLKSQVLDFDERKTAAQINGAGGNSDPHKE